MLGRYTTGPLASVRPTQQADQAPEAYQLHCHSSERDCRAAGVLGLEPRLTGPEPVGLPITPYPIAGVAAGARTYVELESTAFRVSDIDCVAMRYGFFYGPGTWYPNEKRAKPALHVDAAAQAALLTVSKGKHGIYNIAEDDGVISSEKAKHDLGFDAEFRI